MPFTGNRVQMRQDNTPVPDDLSDLSIQTENFAHRFNRSNASSTSSQGQTSNNGGTSAFSHSGGSSSIGLSSSLAASPMDRVAPTINRGSSYSSIVSSSNSGGSNGSNSEPKTLTNSIIGGTSRMMDSSANEPVFGKGMRFGSSFSPFSNDCLPGIVTESLGAPNHGLHSNLWNPDFTQANTDHMNGAFGHQDSNSMQSFGLNSASGLDSTMYGSNDPNLMYPMYHPNTSESLNQPQLSMMQQLQMERRRRLWEHQQKVSKGEDWPGFNTPLIRNDSLWDPDYKPPMEHSWSTNVDNASAANTGFWSTLTNSASSGWSSLGQSLANIWGNTPQQETARTTGGFPPVAQPPTPPTQQVTGGTPFNLYPIPSMADIWSPSPGSGVTSSTAPTSTGSTSPMGSSAQWMSNSNTQAPDSRSPGSLKEE